MSFPKRPYNTADNSSRDRWPGRVVNEHVSRFELSCGGEAGPNRAGASGAAGHNDVGRLASVVRNEIRVSDHDHRIAGGSHGLHSPIENAFSTQRLKLFGTVVTES